MRQSDKIIVFVVNPYTIVFGVFVWIVEYSLNDWLDLWKGWISRRSVSIIVVEWWWIVEYSQNGGFISYECTVFAGNC